jgi:hypothetical protein
MEGVRARGHRSRLPPLYLYGQLMRAFQAVWREFRKCGREGTVRKEMNVAYFLGKIQGWLAGPRG